MLRKKSAVAAVDAMDRSNFDGLTRMLGTVALLPDDIEALYVQHAETIDRHLVTSQSKAAGALFVLCRKHLVLDATSLFRLYSAQMFRETRAAVEAAGIARAVQADEAIYKVFREDDGSEVAAGLARKTFTSRRLFPKEKPPFELLSEFYDTASRLSHTSGLTFMRHIVHDPKTGKVDFLYQDVGKENLNRDLPQQVFWLCLAHICILVSSDVTFSSLGADLAGFQRERAAIFERVGRFKAAHQARYPSAGPL
jgi:hypothetical protein